MEGTSPVHGSIGGKADYPFKNGTGYLRGSEVYFRQSHRLMHARGWLKRSHLVHHRSYNVTPVSAYSFDLAEAILNMLPFWGLLLTVPWHPLMVLTFSLGGILYNGYLHLGYDFWPNARRHPLGKWFNTATHHSIHHQTYGSNYGVYFTFWDKWMGTESLPAAKSRSD